MISKFAKNVLPVSIIDILKTVRARYQAAEKTRVERIFSAATTFPPYLDSASLKTLAKAYPHRISPEYDPRTLEQRGATRAAHLLSLAAAGNAKDFLELGCWDGMVSCALSRNAVNATAIDSRDTGFDPRAARQGVKLLTMDAMNLQFPDESFDFVFSYDAFEHFSSPEDVMNEAVRVLRKGGYIYLEFGPLYHSPFGQHIYRALSLPYCQCLFPKEVLAEYAADAKVEFTDMNEWPVSKFRGLWRKYSSTLQKISYHEQIDLNYLDLIRSNPSCFKSKSGDFDDFIVSNISVLFKKIA